MASVLITTGASENRLNSAAVQHVHTPGDVPLFRFRLRQLLLFVAAICTLLAGMVSASGLLALALLLASVVVAMHVFATALGHRLQLRTEQERLRNAAESSIEESLDFATERSAKLAAIRSAPRSPWHGRGGTYLPWLPRLVIGAMFLGGIAGALLLGVLIGHRVSPSGIAVGATSFAVLGGWFAFLGGSFYGVFRHGFRDAVSEQQHDRTRPISRP